MAHLVTSPPHSTIRLSRTMSQSQRTNRMSPSFPVAPRKSSVDSTGQNPSQTTTPTTPSTPGDTQISLTDPSGFLVALAGQERHVLELKEELLKAENTLKDLKKQWARYEADKKKGEIRRIEPLQQIQCSGLEDGELHNLGILDRRSVEENRRKTLIETLNLPKETRRTFSGSHTRKLSLLSPDRSNYNQPSNDIEINESSLRRRSMILPESTQAVNCTSSNPARHSYRSSGVVNGAKQLAGLAEGVTEGFKAGMWTFLEDLRQATVGDEAINGNSNTDCYSPESLSNKPLRKCRRTSLPENDKCSSLPKAASPRTWETLAGTPPPTDSWLESESHLQTYSPSKNRKSLPLSSTASLDESDDPWSIWDEPIPLSPRWSGSSTMSGPVTPPDGNSFVGDIENTNQLSDDFSTLRKSEHATWRALEKFSPGNFKENLQLAVGSILKELEKSSKIISDDRSNSSARQPTKAETTPQIPEQPTQEQVIFMSG